MISSQRDIDISSARKDQALGELLPKIDLSGGMNRNRRNYQQKQSLFPSSTEYYDSNSWQINFSQPIINFAAIFNLRQNLHYLDQANLIKLATEQELIAKYIETWMSIQSALANVDAESAKKDYAASELSKAKIGHLNDLVNEPELIRAQAEFDIASSDVDQAASELEIAISNLELLSGQAPSTEIALLEPKLDRLNAPFETNTQLELSNTLNPRINAAKKAADAAKQEIQKQSAGLLPTLELVANYSEKKQQEGDYPSQSGYSDKAGYVGLQLNIPIFSGGGQLAKKKEAQAQYEKALSDIEKERRNATQRLKQALQEYASAQRRQRAMHTSLSAAQLELVAARRSRDFGNGSDIEVFKAQLQVANTKRDEIKAICDKVSAYFNIKANTASINEADIQQLAEIFVEP